MGSQNTKISAQTVFTPEELKTLEASFREVSGHSEKLSEEKLLAAWSIYVDTHLVKCTASYLFTSSQQRITSIGLHRFAEPFYIVERGTIDEKLSLLAGSMDRTESNQFATKELENYVASVLKSFLSLQETQQQNVAHESWKKNNYKSAERSILAFAKGLIRGVAKEHEHYVNLESLEHWLQVSPTFLMIWREVFAHLYSKHAGRSQKLGSSFAVTSTNILPLSEGLTSFRNYMPILDVPHVMFINSNLPNELRHKWRFLFSSKLMGESFSTMLGKITERGPTLIIVEDEDRFIFAGYAPESWALRPSFHGDDTAMLFTLCPAMRCFNATGYNNHFQYLNLNQQTMPNGLGMGGQFNYWGLWLDSEYGLGHSSESCTTFRDYVQLSKRKDFRVRNLEVWGIGDEPKASDDSDEETNSKRSVLDKNLEDRVMLELSGREMHSVGLRDPDINL